MSELIIKVDPEHVEPMRAFYRDVVGLTPENDDGWFWTGEPGSSGRFMINRPQRSSIVPMLEMEESAPMPEPERWRVPHFAFEVPDSRLEEAAEHVRNQGVDVYGPADLAWMNARAYYFWDPAGHLVEFWSLKI